MDLKQLAGVARAFLESQTPAGGQPLDVFEDEAQAVGDVVVFDYNSRQFVATGDEKYFFVGCHGVAVNTKSLECKLLSLLDVLEMGLDFDEER